MYRVDDIYILQSNHHFSETNWGSILTLFVDLVVQLEIKMGLRLTETVIVWALLYFAGDVSGKIKWKRTK